MLWKVMQAYTINRTAHQVLSIQYTYILACGLRAGLTSLGELSVCVHTAHLAGAHAASYSGIALKAADFMTFTKVSSEGYLHGQETYLH